MTPPNKTPLTKADWKVADEDLRQKIIEVINRNQVMGLNEAVMIAIKETRQSSQEKVKRLEETNFNLLKEQKEKVG